jgi:hypothetical protein
MNRLLYIDNIRWVIIVLAVLIHLNSTYSNIGIWYYKEEGVNDFFSWWFFLLTITFTQIFFMGFLFFIAGYFVPGSLDRKGNWRFTRDRLIRLGIPVIVYMLILNPITQIIMYYFNHSFPFDLKTWYIYYLTSFNFLSGSGPLWFALALLIFTLFYVMLRLIVPKSLSMTDNGKPIVITSFHVLFVIILFSLCSFLVRLVQPIGTTFYNLQFSYFSGYIILFSLGIIAYRRNLLTNLPSELGKLWLKLALGLGIPFWLIIMILGGVSKSWNPYSGGFYWQAVAYAIWGAFFCVGFCLGLIVLFRDYYNTQGKVSHFLSENAFGVFSFHSPIVVWATMLVRGIIIYPLLKFILMSIILLPVCFGVSYLIRKIPLMKRIFT